MYHIFTPKNLSPHQNNIIFSQFSQDSHRVVHNIPSCDFTNLKFFLYEKKAATDLPTCFHDIITQFIYAAIGIFIRFLGCISLNISACIFAAMCIYICVVLIELWPRICCTQLISTPSSIK